MQPLRQISLHGLIAYEPAVALYPLLNLVHRLLVIGPEYILQLFSQTLWIADYDSMLLGSATVY